MSEGESLMTESDEAEDSAFRLDLDGGGNSHEMLMHQLADFLNKRSNPSLDRPRGYDLRISKVVITRPLLSRLLTLLSHGTEEARNVYVDETNNNNNMDHALGTTCHNAYICIEIETDCRFFSPNDVTTADQDDHVCSPDDKLRFVSALARAPTHLEICRNCPEIISALLATPNSIDHLEVQALCLHQETPLTELEYSRLGAMIQRSVKLTDLHLELPFLDVPQAFYDGLANAIHIEIICVRSSLFSRRSNYHREEFSSNFYVREDGNGALERLLRNPQNQLKELDLSISDLEDHHLAGIARLLPTSQVQEIGFVQTKVQCRGVLEFARYLPEMHSLTNIDLAINPFEKDSLEARKECGAAFLHGLMQNTSVTWVDDMESFPQLLLLCHHISLNRAGRKFLTPPSSPEQSIPVGLWPHILERAGENFENRWRTFSSNIDDEDDKDEFVYNASVNAVYFFLQNYPKLFSYYK